MVFALIEAEEYGITQANVDQMKTEQRSGRAAHPRHVEDTGKLLGLDKDWAYRAIKAVGNYGEIFERNVGPKSALKLPRGAEQSVEQGRPDVRAADPLSDCAARTPSSSRPSRKRRAEPSMADRSRR